MTELGIHKNGDGIHEGYIFESELEILMRKSGLGVMLGIALIALATPAAVFAATSGTIDFYVSYGTCTSTWSGNSAIDGNVPGLFNNNIGGAGFAPIVGTGSICVRVILTGATPNTTYNVTSNKLSGFLLIHTDGSGNGDNYTLFTSTWTGQCTTVPIKLGPTAPFNLTAGQISHAWVGTGLDATGGVSCSNGHLVPEFPLGMLGVLALGLPALFVLRRRFVKL